jgi:predicted NAD/FAD-dependent oxidoreductase
VTVGIVGAGLAGLSAARRLHAAGEQVVLVDKGRGPGGRMATRRIADATVDHGAQFFTARDPVFATLVQDWMTAGLVREWCRGFDELPDGHPRYVVEGGMNALAKHLATGLDLRSPAMAFGLRKTGESATPGWAIKLDDASLIDCDAVVVATPVPQALAIVITGGIDLPVDLRSIDYDRTLALLVVLDRPAALPPGPGAVQHGDDTFSMIVDNERKGISRVPAVTFHANPQWSLAWWERDRAETAAALLLAARPWLGEATVLEHQVKRWRLATPQRLWPDRCWVAPGAVAPLVLAGDAFAGPRVEGAVLSGLAAADAVLAALASRAG